MGTAVEEKREKAADGLAGGEAFLHTLERVRKGEEGASLAGGMFSGVNLIGRDLSGLDLSRCDFTGADLSRARLEGANLSFAVLKDAALYQAHLERCELLGADLSRANLIECAGDRAGFGGAILEGASLVNASLKSATLSKAKLKDADFSAADLQGARIRESDLRHANFSRADMRHVDFEGSDLAHASFDGTNLCVSRLKGIKNFKDASWIGADIRDVNFTGAYLVRRFIMDENYLYEFKNRSPFSNWIYWVWWITSDCGRSFFRWGLWTALIALVFAGLYGLVDLSYGEHETSLSPIYFSVVTLTTLGYGDVLPASLGAQILAVMEVALGYLALGGLLSIFANKMARRAD